MLKGRLGLHSSRIPHADRTGLLYLARGQLVARDGTLAFLRGNEADEVLPPGVYLAPQLSAAVCERTWAVLSEWHAELRRGAIVLAWPDPKRPGGMAIETLGDAPKEIVDADGVLLVRRRHAPEGISL